MLNDFGESKVTVKKEELLNAIRKNRETHRESFLKAQKGYRETVIKALDQTLAEAREGQRFVLERITALVMPQEHTTDYDRVIKMLEMCVADEVTVTEQQFSQYVLDDWGWKKQFITTNARYSL
jgi:hypothetical protein